MSTSLVFLQQEKGASDIDKVAVINLFNKEYWKLLEQQY